MYLVLRRHPGRRSRCSKLVYANPSEQGGLEARTINKNDEQHNWADTETLICSKKVKIEMKAS